MKKRICLSLIILICVLLGAASCEPKQYELGQNFIYGDGAFEIIVDDIIIKNDEDWLKEAQKAGNDMIAIVVHVTVKNESYSKKFGTFAARDIANLISVNDQNGFSLLYGSYNFSLLKDGNYSVDTFDEIKKGTKTRISLPYYADKGITEATVILGGGLAAISVPLKNDISDSNEALAETKESNKISDYEMDNLEKRIEDLEKRVKLLEEVVNKKESDQGKNSNSANDQKSKENAGPKGETDENICYTTLVSYMKKPSAARMLNSVELPLPQENYILYLMDINAENQYGATNTNSYFVVFDRDRRELSAISFDRVVSHSEKVSDMNNVYAQILNLQDGTASYLVNQLSMEQSTFANYLYTFYDYFYKKTEYSPKNSPTMKPTATLTAKPTATPTAAPTPSPTATTEPVDNTNKTAKQPDSTDSSGPSAGTKWEEVFIPGKIINLYNDALFPVFKTLFNDDKLAGTAETDSRVYYRGIDNNTLVYSNRAESVFFFFGGTIEKDQIADNVCCYTSLNDNVVLKNLPQIAFAYAVSQLDNACSFEEFGDWVNDSSVGDTVEYPHFTAYCNGEYQESISILLSRKQSSNVSNESQEDGQIKAKTELEEARRNEAIAGYIRAAVSYVQSKKVFDYLDIRSTEIMISGDAAVVLMYLRQSDWLATMTYEQGAVVYVNKTEDGKYTVNKNDTMIKEPAILDVARKNGSFVTVDYYGVAYKVALNYTKEKEYEKAIEWLEVADGDYHNEEKTDECRYTIATQLEADKKYGEASKIFANMNTASDYPDLQDHVLNCNYQDALIKMQKKEYKEAAELFLKCTEVSEYLDAAEKARECYYQEAKALLDQKKYEDALLLLESDETYKDSKELIAMGIDAMFGENITTVGTTVRFGRFEQDNEETNGEETIEWTVVDVQKNKSLLVCKNALMIMVYNERRSSGWGGSKINKWLNNDFLK